ncbi:MAG: class IV adenylate cyclase [Thermodesulfobacteriota bacterium]
MKGPIETEVKFFLLEPEEIRCRLHAFGAESLGRIFERNTVYDDGKESLRKRGGLLRLRRDRKILLTSKQPPEKPDPDVKAFLENEIEVSDADATERILAFLGFFPRLVYEKWREEFVLPDARAMLDELPFGPFLEIEAPPERIRDLANQLGMPWERRIRKTYLDLFAEAKKNLGLSFADLTFENFAASPDATRKMRPVWNP